MWKYCLVSYSRTSARKNKKSSWHIVGAQSSARRIRRIRPEDRAPTTPILCQLFLGCGVSALVMLLFSLAVNPVFAQTCNDHIPASTPDSRFTDNGNGTITDNVTGLMWKKCVEGLSGTDCSTGSDETFTWKEALARPGVVNSSGGFAGHTDWRLPNIKELVSIVEEKCYDPAINLTFFPNTPSSGVWSGSADAYHSYYAWGVDFYYGHSGYTNRNNHNRVRLVRGGQ